MLTSSSGSFFWCDIENCCHNDTMPTWHRANLESRYCRCHFMLFACINLGIHSYFFSFSRYVAFVYSWNAGHDTVCDPCGLRNRKPHDVSGKGSELHQHRPGTWVGHRYVPSWAMATSRRLISVWFVFGVFNRRSKGFEQHQHYRCSKGKSRNRWSDGSWKIVFGCGFVPHARTWRQGKIASCLLRSVIYRS